MNIMRINVPSPLWFSGLIDPFNNSACPTPQFCMPTPHLLTAMTIASLAYHFVSVSPVRHLLRYLLLQESCYPYWPTDQGLTRKYGEIGVTLKSEEKYYAYMVRKFEVLEDKSKSTAVSKQIIPNFTSFIHQGIVSLLFIYTYRKQGALPHSL